jgi:hypothetical protein
MIKFYLYLFYCFIQEPVCCLESFFGIIFYMDLYAAIKVFFIFFVIYTSPS